MLLTAALALPMTGADPIPDAALLIDGERIVAVGPRATITARPDAAGHERLDFGDAILLPGLVNAHIHLEFTHLGPIPAPTPFFPWIRGLVAWSQGRTMEDWARSARDGAAQSIRGGVTCLGEILTRSVGLSAMREVGLHGVGYLEFIGGHGAAIDDALARFDARVADARATLADGGNSTGLRLGLSPHTPYTVAGPAISAVAARAHAAGVPLAIHLAESPGEVALLRDGTGVIADYLRTIEPDGAPRPPYRDGGHGIGPVEYVAGQGLFAPDHPTLLIHGAQFDAADIASIQSHGAAIVLCPRSNDLLVCGEPPAAALLAAGITLAIGTDSLGSNRDLDLFNELRALAAIIRRQRGGDVDEAALARRLLAIATSEGARAIAMDDLVGSLAPGKLADVAVLDLPATGAGDDPYRAILDAGTAAHVRCTIAGGRVAYLAH